MPNSRNPGRPESNPGSVWRASIGAFVEDRAINGERDHSHEYYAFVVERSNGAPTEGLRNGLIGAKMFYLWGGNPGMLPAGQSERSCCQL